MAATSLASALLYDFLTDLPLISAWANQFPGGVFSLPGGIIAINFVGIGQLQQRHGHTTAEMVVQEIIARCQHYLPYEGTLVRGVMCELLIWLPQATPAVTEAIRYQLCIDVCPLPIPLPDGSQYYPRVLAAAKDVTAGDLMLETIRELELLLYRETAVNRIPPPPDANATLQARVLAEIAAHELFSYEHFLELTLAHLDLPEPHPRSVFIVGATSTGATRLLTSEALLLESVGYSAITVICHPQNRDVPFYLVCALLSHFLWGMNRGQYQAQLAGYLAYAPWLAMLFPMLRQQFDPPPIPTNKSVLRRGLCTLLRAIASDEYLVAVIQDIHFADEDSRSLLAELQLLPDHGLRIIASMEPADRKILQKFHKHQPMVIHTLPLTPMQVLEYLHAVLPDIAIPEAAVELHYETGGAILEIEITLSRWMDEGRLFCENGKWCLHLDDA